MGIYYRGNLITPILEVPTSIYDNVEQSTSNIVLSESITTYIVKPTETSTLIFDITNLRFLTSKFVTFKLVLDMTDGVQNITWPADVQWQDSTPVMTTASKYMFSFIKPAGESVWLGSKLFTW